MSGGTMNLWLYLLISASSLCAVFTFGFAAGKAHERAHAVMRDVAGLVSSSDGFFERAMKVER